MADEFDFFGRKLMTALIETAEAYDGLQEPFRSAGIQALEEFVFRISGVHFDWEEYKIDKQRYEEAMADYLRGANAEGPIPS